MVARAAFNNYMPLNACMQPSILEYHDATKRYLDQLHATPIHASGGVSGEDVQGSDSGVAQEIRGLLAAVEPSLIAMVPSDDFQR